MQALGKKFDYEKVQVGAAGRDQKLLLGNCSFRVDAVALSTQQHNAIALAAMRKGKAADSSPSQKSECIALTHCSRDWPVVHGLPQRLPAYIYIPAETKEREGGIDSCN